MIRTAFLKYARHLEGRSALVARSTSGIGLGIAHALAARGANLMLNGFSDAGETDAMRRRLARESGVQVADCGADVSDPAAVRGLVGACIEAFGSMLYWSAVLMISFELARRARSYDSRSFFKLLLGRAGSCSRSPTRSCSRSCSPSWGAAAGEIAHSLFGLPKLVGSLGMILATGLLLFYGTATIERFLALSVGYLYLVYIVFVIWFIAVFGERIESALAPDHGSSRP